jgi:CYTH domain-containing protein
MTWQIDVHEGPLDGIVFAEVELEREDQPLELPTWVGREVTGDPHFKKANLFRLHAAVAPRTSRT